VFFKKEQSRSSRALPFLASVVGYRFFFRLHEAEHPGDPEEDDGRHVEEEQGQRAGDRDGEGDEYPGKEEHPAGKPRLLVGDGSTHQAEAGEQGCLDAGEGLVAGDRGPDDVNRGQDTQNSPDKPQDKLFFHILRWMRRYIKVLPAAGMRQGDPPAGSVHPGKVRVFSL
jgi:hypothetical protein